MRLAEFGIRVYEIRPGVIATDMTGAVKEKYDKLIIQDERGITPIRRWGKPEDIGRAVQTQDPRMVEHMSEAERRPSKSAIKIWLPNEPKVLVIRTGRKNRSASGC